jgi:hypothetical protein
VLASLIKLVVFLLQAKFNGFILPTLAILSLTSELWIILSKFVFSLRIATIYVKERSDEWYIMTTNSHPSRKEIRSNKVKGPATQASGSVLKNGISWVTNGWGREVHIFVCMYEFDHQLNQCLLCIVPAVSFE